MALPVSCGLIYAVLYSLGTVGVLNTETSTKAWSAVLFGQGFWTSIGFSFYVGIVSVSIAIAIALSIALNWKRALNKGFLSTFIYIPLCFPGTVMAFVSFQSLSKSGLLSRIGFKAGWIEDLQQFPSLINDAYGFGIIFTSILLITPFFIILFSNLHNSEHIESYKQLASTFGASKRQILFKVTLPILLKRSQVTLLLFVVFVMGSYEVPLLLGRQHPQMISVATLQKIQRFNLYDIPQGYAMSVLYVCITVSILGLLYLKNPEFFKSDTQTV